MQIHKRTSVDEYITSFPKTTQQKLQWLRIYIRKLAPQAQEMISYNMPAYKINGKVFAYFAWYDKHIGLYPTPVALASLQDDLKGYVTGKGSVQFPLDKELPESLIKKILQFRLSSLWIRN